MFWQHHGIEKRDLLVPASILIGAILISITICVSISRIGGSSLIKSGDESPVDDSLPVKVVERRDAPKLGQGKVKMIEFADFQCPFCQSFYNEAYKQIKADYVDTGKVQFEYRHYPLSFHQNAQVSAEASECANRQGKFFEYYDVLFARGKADGTGLASTDLKSYATQLGLDMNKFTQCLDGGETEATVKADFDAGQKAGVTGTPTIFINGKKIVGNQPYEVFKNEIESALK